MFRDDPRGDERERQRRKRQNDPWNDNTAHDRPAPHGSEAARETTIEEKLDAALRKAAARRMGKRQRVTPLQWHLAISHDVKFGADSSRAAGRGFTWRPNRRDPRFAPDLR